MHAYVPVENNPQVNDTFSKWLISRYCRLPKNYWKQGCHALTYAVSSSFGGQSFNESLLITATGGKLYFIAQFHDTGVYSGSIMATIII